MIKYYTIILINIFQYLLKLMNINRYNSEFRISSNYMKDNQQYQQKLKDINQYQKHIQNISENVFRSPEVRKQIQGITNVIRNQQIIQARQQYVTFYDFRYKAFTLDCRNKIFPVTIKVSSNLIQATIYISYSSIRPSKANYSEKYVVKGKKLILLETERKIENIYIGIQIKQQDQGLLSFVSLLVFFSSLKKSKTSEKSLRNFRSKSYKKQQRQKLEQFISKNLKSAKQILSQKKNNYKIDFIQLNKNLYQSPKASTTSLFKIKYSTDRLSQTKQKFNYITFQNEKGKYISHLSKMNLTIPQKIQKSRQKFQSQKNLNIRYSTIFIKLFSFFHYLGDQQHQHYQKFMRGTRVNNICKRFIRKLKNRMRRKMQIANKLKAGLREGLYVSCKIMQPAVQKNVNHLISNLFNNIQYKRIKENILQQSLKYLKKIKLIQQYWRTRNQIRKKAFDWMIIKYVQKNKVNETLKKLGVKTTKQKIYTKYIVQIVKRYKKLKEDYKNNKIKKKIICNFFNNRMIIKDIISKDLKN